jgi:hypothetical protein
LEPNIFPAIDAKKPLLGRPSFVCLRGRPPDGAVVVVFVDVPEGDLTSVPRLSDDDVDNLCAGGSGKTSFACGASLGLGNLGLAAAFGVTGRGICGTDEGEGFAELAVDAGREPNDEGTEGGAPFCGGARYRLDDNKSGEDAFGGAAPEDGLAEIAGGSDLRLSGRGVVKDFDPELALTSSLPLSRTSRAMDAAFHFAYLIFSSFWRKY